MQIKWLVKADADLNTEAEYIARENPQAATDILTKIHNAVRLLPQNPALGHAGRIHGTRELIIPNTPYVVPYRVNKKQNRIEIIRVFHTSRKPPKKW